MESLPQVHVDREETKKQVIFGGARTDSFIKRVAIGEMIDGKKYAFDSDLITELHNRVCMAPGVKALLRQTGSTTVGGEPAGPTEGLQLKFTLFGRWLGEEVARLRSNTADPILALEIAAAAHYGLTRPEFHPFDNGNGRTARALVNILLMLNTCELMKYGLAVPPVPILRSTTIGEKEDHYIRSLRAVKETNSLNPFMTFLAQKWVENLRERIKKIQDLVKISQNPIDQQLLAITENRVIILENFINSGNVKYQGHGDKNDKVVQYSIYPIPDGYFKPRYVKFANA